MKVITVTGAESCGKSTLSQQLASHYNACLVTEYSRAYLSTLGRPYEEDDLLTIAQGQIESEEKSKNDCSLLICDTSLLVMKVWGLYKYGRSNPWIDEQLLRRKCDLYILPHYDIPYEADPLRENPDDRDVLYDMYNDEISKLQLPFLPVSGNAEERLSQSIAALDQFILT